AVPASTLSSVLGTIWTNMVLFVSVFVGPSRLGNCAFPLAWMQFPRPAPAWEQACSSSSLQLPVNNSGFLLENDLGDRPKKSLFWGVADRFQPPLEGTRTVEFLNLLTPGNHTQSSRSGRARASYLPIFTGTHRS